MEAFRQALGAVYFALAEAAGGDEVLDQANNILANAVTSGAINDPYARAAVMALVRSSCSIDEPAVYGDEWLLDIADNLGPRPGARAAHQKLKQYAGTDYPRDRDSGTVPTGINGTLFLMLEARGGDFLPVDQIQERLRARRGQECHAV